MRVVPRKLVFRPEGVFGTFRALFFYPVKIPKGVLI